MKKLLIIAALALAACGDDYALYAPSVASAAKACEPYGGLFKAVGYHPSYPYTRQVYEAQCKDGTVVRGFAYLPP